MVGSDNRKCDPHRSPHALAHGYWNKSTALSSGLYFCSLATCRRIRNFVARFLASAIHRRRWNGHVSFLAENLADLLRESGMQGNVVVGVHPRARCLVKIVSLGAAVRKSHVIACEQYGILM